MASAVPQLPPPTTDAEENVGLMSSSSETGLRTGEQATQVFTVPEHDEKAAQPARDEDGGLGSTNMEQKRQRRYSEDGSRRYPACRDDGHEKDDRRTQSGGSVEK
jgi:hypothetical protein